jgi:hypothetical protein
MSFSMTNGKTQRPEMEKERKPKRLRFWPIVYYTLYYN